MIKIGENIALKRKSSGIWHISHPGRDGLKVSYSTGIRGSVKEVTAWVKEENIKDIIEVGLRTRLSSAVINRLQNNNREWPEIIEEWEKSQRRKGRSPRTIINNTKVLTRFLREMNVLSRNVNEVDEDHVYEWLNNRVSTKRSSRNTMFHALKSAWKFLETMGYCERNITINTGIDMSGLSHKQKETKKINTFTKTEFNELVDCIRKGIEETDAKIADRSYGKSSGYKAITNYSGGLRAKRSYYKFFLSACNLSYGLGLRLSDVAQLCWDSLESDGWLIVHTEKSNTRIMVPYMPNTIDEYLQSVPKEIAGRVKDALTESAIYVRTGITEIGLEEDEFDPYFCFPYWREEYQKHPSKLSLYFKRICDDNDILGKTFHCLRHTRIRRWRDQGLDIKLIGKLVGHSNESTTKGYLYDPGYRNPNL